MDTTSYRTRDSIYLRQPHLDTLGALVEIDATIRGSHPSPDMPLAVELSSELARAPSQAFEIGRP